MEQAEKKQPLTVEQVVGGGLCTAHHVELVLPFVLAPEQGSTGDSQQQIDETANQPINQQTPFFLKGN
jgi:hypothetical protein